MSLTTILKTKAGEVAEAKDLVVHHISPDLYPSRLEDPNLLSSSHQVHHQSQVVNPLQVVLPQQEVHLYLMGNNPSPEAVVESHPHHP